MRCEAQMHRAKRHTLAPPGIRRRCCSARACGRTRTMGWRTLSSFNLAPAHVSRFGNDRSRWRRLVHLRIGHGVMTGRIRGEPHRRQWWLCIRATAAEASRYPFIRQAERSRRRGPWPADERHGSPCGDTRGPRSWRSCTRPSAPAHAVRLPSGLLRSRGHEGRSGPVRRTSEYRSFPRCSAG